MSAINFLKTEKVKLKPYIPPVRTADSCTEEELEKIDTWLAFCSIGTTILDTGTKMLRNLKVIHDRNAIFDLISAFKDLRSYFGGNTIFEAKEREIDDFMFTFLTSDEETQKRVIKFQGSIVKKQVK